MSGLSNLLSLVKGDLELDLIPVGIGALQILQKQPNAAGVAAAELYVMGNAPAALITSETSLIQAELNALQAKLAAIQTAAASASAAAAAKPA